MESQKKPLLIISWAVFPAQKAMSLLTHQLANAFEKDEVVVVGEFSKDSSDWDDPPQYPLYHIDPNPFPFSQGERYFKWSSFYKSVKTVERIIEKNNCSAVLCPFPDEYYMMLAMKVAKRKGLPFYPWFHNTYLENRTGLLFKLAKRFQPLFFKNAKMVFSISQGLTDYYQQQYPDVSFTTLLHGFNIPDVQQEHFKIGPSQKIKFAYTGGFSESCRDAAVRLAKVISAEPNYELHIFGKRNAEVFKSYGIEESEMIVYGFLPDEEFNQKLKACDVMLLPHGFDGKRSEVEYNTIFPTRTIPFLYSNRPIILHSPPNASLTRFFSTNDCGLIIDSKNEKEIAASIKKFILDNKKINQVIKNAFLISKQYDVNTVAQSLKEQIHFDH